jgi:hypothetical protein
MTRPIPATGENLTDRIIEVSETPTTAPDSGLHFCAYSNRKPLSVPSSAVGEPNIDIANHFVFMFGHLDTTRMRILAPE